MRNIIKLLKLDNIKNVPDSIKGSLVANCFLTVALFIFGVIYSILERNIKIPLMLLVCIIGWYIYLYLDKLRPFLTDSVKAVQGKVIKEPSSSDGKTPAVLNSMKRNYIYFRDEKGRGYQMPVGKSKGLPFEGTDICVYYSNKDIPQLNRGFVYISSPILWETLKTSQ